jgi:hypothetical protein
MQLENTFLSYNSIAVLPYIMPFEFDGPASAGDTVQLACQVTKGDLPISIAWYFDGQIISPHMGVLASMFGTRAKFLSIASVRQAHAGRYTCLATNTAGTAAYAADLHVNGGWNQNNYCFCYNLLIRALT